MIDFSFRLSSSWNTEPSGSLLSIDEMDIRYCYFLGDITFKADSADFSMQVGWIPIADFASAMCAISEQLEEGLIEAAFEFTENNERLVFRRLNGDIQITASYTSSSASVPMDELSSAIRRFADQVCSELLKLYPDLKHNAAFLKMFPPLHQ